MLPRETRSVKHPARAMPSGERLAGGAARSASFIVLVLVLDLDCTGRTLASKRRIEDEDEHEHGDEKGRDGFPRIRGHTPPRLFP